MKIDISKNLGKRIRQAMTLRKIKNEAELAKLANIPQTNLNRLLSGKSINPTLTTLIPVSDALGISIDSLIGSRAQSDKLIEDSQQEHIGTWKQLPFIGWNKLSEYKSILHSISQDPLSWNAWETTNVRCSEGVFATKVNNDSMQPLFDKNTLLIVDTNAKPKHHDFVIARLDDDTTYTFKRLIIDGSDKYLKPLNSEFVTKLISGRIEFLGVVIQSQNNY